MRLPFNCINNRRQEKTLFLLFSKNKAFLTGFSLVQLWGCNVCLVELNFLRSRSGALAVVASLFPSCRRCFQRATCASFAELLIKRGPTVSLGRRWHSSPCNKSSQLERAGVDGGRRLRLS